MKRLYYLIMSIRYRKLKRTLRRAFLNPGYHVIHGVPRQMSLIARYILHGLDKQMTFQQFYEYVKNGQHQDIQEWKIKVISHNNKECIALDEVHYNMNDFFKEENK